MLVNHPESNIIKQAKQSTIFYREEEGAITNPDGTKAEGGQKEEDAKKDAAGEGEEKEGEEEEEVQYTEDEEAIIQYLKEDEPLPNELYEKIVGEWWNAEPFK